MKRNSQKPISLDAPCVGFAGYSTIGAHVPQYEPFFLFRKDEREQKQVEHQNCERSQTQDNVSDVQYVP
jgi:hypothetical protein